MKLISRKHVTERPVYQLGRTDWANARLMTTCRHKAFRAYILMPQARPPMTSHGRQLTKEHGNKLFQIKMIFHLLVNKSLNQQMFNLNLTSMSMRPFANLVLIDDFLSEAFVQEFGYDFETFIGW